MMSCAFIKLYSRFPPFNLQDSWPGLRRNCVFRSCSGVLKIVISRGHLFSILVFKTVETAERRH